MDALFAPAHSSRPRATSFVENGSDDDANWSMVAAATLSGASGKYLAQELAGWRKRKSPHFFKRLDLAHMERQVNNFYDQPLGPLFNLLYDILQFSSGRDKFCGFLQNFAKLASDTFTVHEGDWYWMYRHIEEDFSDGRKIFRLFKEFREVYKMRRGFHRILTGVAESGLASIPAVCGSLDVLAHVASFFFYLFDNLLWAASVGLVRAKEVPKWQRKMWLGGRHNGKVIRFFGGVANIKRMKNFASFYRIVLAFVANALLMHKARRECAAKGGKFEGPDDPRLFHALELIGMAVSFRDLLSRLDLMPMMSDAQSGLLGMVGSAVGLWSNWRKVCKDQCGTKTFSPVMKRPMSAPNLSK